jgi:hypothetical protein
MEKRSIFEHLVDHVWEVENERELIDRMKKASADYSNTHRKKDRFFDQYKSYVLDHMIELSRNKSSFYHDYLNKRREKLNLPHELLAAEKRRIFDDLITNDWGSTTRNDLDVHMKNEEREFSEFQNKLKQLKKGQKYQMSENGSPNNKTRKNHPMAVVRLANIATEAETDVKEIKKYIDYNNPGFLKHKEFMERLEETSNKLNGYEDEFEHVMRKTHDRDVFVEFDKFKHAKNYLQSILVQIMKHMASQPQQQNRPASVPPPIHVHSAPAPAPAPAPARAPMTNKRPYYPSYNDSAKMFENQILAGLTRRINKRKPPTKRRQTRRRYAARDSIFAV